MMQIPPIIALIGPAGSGKSTTAAALAQALTAAGHRAQIRPMAAALRAMLMPLLQACGMSSAQAHHALHDQAGKSTPIPTLGTTPRHLMQTLGTEWGRDCISPQIWLDIWRAQSSADIAAGGIVIVDDARFPNEVTAISNAGGLVVRLPPRSPESLSHASETQTLPAGLTLPCGRTPQALAHLIMAAWSQP